MQDFKKLTVWQKSHAFVLRVYSASSEFPDRERYGLTSQLRRAAASIPTNIAEGCGRSSRTELRQFLYISSGSAGEAEYLMILARDLRYISAKQHGELTSQVTEIKRMITGLIQRISKEHEPKLGS